MKDKICFECERYLYHPRDIWCGDCIHNGEHYTIKDTRENNFKRNMSSYNQIVKNRIFGKNYRH